MKSRSRKIRSSSAQQGSDGARRLLLFTRSLHSFFVHAVVAVQFYLNDMTCSALLLLEGASPVARAAAADLGVLVYDLRWTADRKLQLIVSGQQGAGVRKPDASAIARAGASSSPVAVPQPDDVALILHTSGTTSAPKAVPLNHRNLTRTLHNICNTYRLQPEDVCMLVMPLFHVHGLMACLLAPLASGGCVVVPPKFSAGSFWSEFAANGCTWYSAVPTIHQILLAHESKQASAPFRTKLKFIRSCSSALAPPTFKQMEETFRVPVVEAYAMTEGEKTKQRRRKRRSGCAYVRLLISCATHFTLLLALCCVCLCVRLCAAAHQMTSNNLPPGQRKAGSVGVGQGVEVAILDTEGDAVPQGKEGEICIRGSNVTKGYLNNPAANASTFTKGGFFRTGDQGLMDRDGFVFVTGRLKELINRGGEKISPLEIDSVLLSHPQVGEAIAFAQPHEMLGQEVAAAVVPKPDAWAALQAAGAAGSPARVKAESELRRSILQHAAGKLSAFKLPKLLFFSDHLPKTATGQCRRRGEAQQRSRARARCAL